MHEAVTQAGGVPAKEAAQKPREPESTESVVTR